MDKPRPGDAVLGNNQAPNTPFNALVLGGIEGASNRLKSTILAVKLEALVSALKYGKEGLKLVHMFVNQEMDPSVKWIVSNWLWLKAPLVEGIINQISCLKHISQELMELVLATMIADSSDTKVMPSQTILEEINKLHSKEASHKSLALGYNKLGDLYCVAIGKEVLHSQNLKVVIAAYIEAIAYDKDLPQLSNILKKRGLAYYFLGDYK